MYDKDNAFAKILRGEIPCHKIAENSTALAFKDISPVRKVHVLVIPKLDYSSFNEFMNHAKEDEVIGLWKLVYKVIEDLDIKTDGYRIIINTGKHGLQEVPHLHIHIIGGESVGSMVQKSNLY